MHTWGGHYSNTWGMCNRMGPRLGSADKGSGGALASPRGILTAVVATANICDKVCRIRVKGDVQASRKGNIVQQCPTMSNNVQDISGSANLDQG